MMESSDLLLSMTSSPYSSMINSQSFDFHNLCSKFQGFHVGDYIAVYGVDHKEYYGIIDVLLWGQSSEKESSNHQNETLTMETAMDWKNEFKAPSHHSRVMIKRKSQQELNWAIINQMDLSPLPPDSKFRMTWLVPDHQKFNWKRLHKQPLDPDDFRRDISPSRSSIESLSCIKYVFYRPHQRQTSSDSLFSSTASTLFDNTNYSIQTDDQNNHLTFHDTSFESTHQIDGIDTNLLNYQQLKDNPTTTKNHFIQSQSNNGLNQMQQMTVLANLNEFDITDFIAVTATLLSSNVNLFYQQFGSSFLSWVKWMIDSDRDRFHKYMINNFKVEYLRNMYLNKGGDRTMLNLVDMNSEKSLYPPPKYMTEHSAQLPSAFHQNLFNSHEAKQYFTLFSVFQLHFLDPPDIHERIRAFLECSLSFLRRTGLAIEKYGWCPVDHLPWNERYSFHLVYLSETCLTKLRHSSLHSTEQAGSEFETRLNPSVEKSHMESIVPRDLWSFVYSSHLPFLPVNESVRSRTKSTSNTTYSSNHSKNYVYRPCIDSTITEHSATDTKFRSSSYLPSYVSASHPSLSSSTSSAHNRSHSIPDRVFQVTDHHWQMYLELELLCSRVLTKCMNDYLTTILRDLSNESIQEKATILEPPALQPTLSTSRKTNQAHTHFQTKKRGVQKLQKHHHARPEDKDALEHCQMKMKHSILDFVKWKIQEETERHVLTGFHFMSSFQDELDSPPSSST